MKFKVGDKVKVKDSSKLDDGAYAGQYGVVQQVEIRGAKWPYRILLNGTSATALFHANELERIE